MSMMVAHLLPRGMPHRAWATPEQCPDGGDGLNTLISFLFSDLQDSTGNGSVAAFAQCRDFDPQAEVLAMADSVKGCLVTVASSWIMAPMAIR